MCKLAAPLWISLLTTTMGYEATAAALIGFAGTTLVAEVAWLRVVWRRFEVLEQAEAVREADRATSRSGNQDCASLTSGEGRNTRSRGLASAARVFAGWNEFRKMPVFLSEYAVRARTRNHAKLILHCPLLAGSISMYVKPAEINYPSC